MKTKIKKAIEIAGFSSRCDIETLAQGGSLREFYRIKDRGKSVIILISNKGDKEFDYYIECAKLLNEIGVEVPEIYYYDRKNKFLLAEDIGNLSLQLAVKNDVHSSFVLYKQVIDVLSRMQVLGAQKILITKFLKKRKFDYDTLRWETEYFSEYFVGKYCHLIGLAEDKVLDFEFQKLAKELSEESLYFMHRDFQSQNIFLKHGKIRIIDFQGARRGLLAYDLVSLLKDSYMVLEDELREELIDYYLNTLIKEWKIKVSPEKFRRTFLYAGLQRNMQALGAFAFLTLVRGKSQFMQYIPAGVRYLKLALKETQDFPKLRELVELLRFNR